ncbi:MAG: MerR family DNA-binding protein [Acidobacteria bacterium]|nr:MerR family DNA-binding protein [Acidobacteriota bacterium]
MQARTAQDLGFTLEEVHDLLEMRSARGIDRDQIRLMAQQKIDSVKDKIRQLQSIRRALDALVVSCACATDDVECPILEALEDEENST